MYCVQHFVEMLLLFLSTVILTGPAWCSHLCYLGTIDHQLTVPGKKRGRLDRTKGNLRHTILLVFVATALLMRIVGVGVHVATWAGALAGGLGLLVMLILSPRRSRILCSSTNFFRFGM